MRDFGVVGKRAGQGQISYGILVAPERRDDRSDDQRNLAVGEAKKCGSAAFEDVRVRTL